jgi:hypothetical protein
MTKRHRAHGPIAVGLLGVVACLPPTEIDVTVTTDDVSCANFQSANLYLGGDASVFSSPGNPISQSSSCDGGYLGKFVILPPGDDSSNAASVPPISVYVVMGLGMDPGQCVDAGASKQCVFAKRDYTFARHVTQEETILMSTLCEGVTCSGTQTCDEGTCVTLLNDGGLADGGPVDAAEAMDAPPGDP